MKIFRQIALILLAMLTLMVLEMGFPQSALAQLSYGGRPAEGPGSRLKSIPVMTMPRFDVARFRQEVSRQSPARLKPMIFARSFELDLTPENDGIWETTSEGVRVWRTGLHSEGALSLNIIFSMFSLEPGVMVFIYDPQQKYILGSFTHLNNQLSGTLATEPVPGDRLYIEMQVPPGTDKYGQLAIGSLNHDFIGILQLSSGQFGRSSACNIDINCPPGNNWQTEKNAIARILTGGNQLCSGVLLNNTAGDGTPYLLTANHCIDDSARAANSIFLFGYESPFCNGGNGDASNSISGSAMVATQPNLDFTLLKLNDIPPVSFNVYYAGWDRSAGLTGNTVAISHPQGDVKKLALSTQPPATGTFGNGYTTGGHWRIEKWDMGTTEGGSSGSPLLDNNGFVRGVLTGGDAWCGDAYNDFFCKFSLAWDLYEGEGSRLKPWLDPEGTGIQSLPGINPHSEGELSARFTISSVEVCAGDQVVFTDLSTGMPENWDWDFGSGANPPVATGQGPHFVEYAQSGMRTVALTVTGNGNSDTETKEYTIAVKTEELPGAGFSYSEDALLVSFLDMSENAASWYWEFGNGNISTLAEPVQRYSDPGNYTVSQLVRNRACSDTMTHMVMVTYLSGFDSNSMNEIRIYPVPARTFLFIERDHDNESQLVIEVINIAGHTLLTNRMIPGETIIRLDTGRLPSGTYLLRLTSPGGSATHKITVLGY